MNLDIIAHSVYTQKMNEVICGHYYIHVLHRLSDGDDFYDEFYFQYDQLNFDNNINVYIRLRSDLK